MKQYKSHINQALSRVQAIWPVVCFKGQAENTGYNDVDLG
jgi:hypothetical protein